jgi:hypothetical protein
MSGSFSRKYFSAKDRGSFASRKSSIRSKKSMTRYKAITTPRQIAMILMSSKMM